MLLLTLLYRGLTVHESEQYVLQGLRMTKKYAIMKIIVETESEIDYGKVLINDNDKWLTAHYRFPSPLRKELDV